ncbi:MAG: L,D-transpeptidase family protein [Anaerolineales bacterium]|nr:L,D-transpeptidase family protein [Anaerolineales bacterium]
MLTRRDFLKLSGAGMLAALLAEHAFPAHAEGTAMLGRVAYSSIRLYSAPHRDAGRLGTFRFDTLLEVSEQLPGGEWDDTNRTWYRIGEQGYVHSGGVQPVDNVLNRALAEIPAGGLIGEVTVPWTESWWAINRRPFAGPKLYYATSHYIEETVIDERDGSLWYKAYDHLYPAYYYVRPEHVRILASEELFPLSAHVPPEDKYIEVRLDSQLVLAFEGDELVFSARTATGKNEFFTPSGWFRTFHKRPTAHMVGGDGSTTFYDLAGVPWNTYITDNGISFHGTFWHNDYGAPRSHGCINLRPQDALWIYRWTMPQVPPGQHYILEESQGTFVRVLETTQPVPRRRMR